MTKRIIALAVTVVLILDIFPIAPFADGAEDGESTSLSETTQETVSETTAEIELLLEEEEIVDETEAELLLEEKSEEWEESQAQTVLGLDNVTFEDLGYTPWDHSYDTEITETTAISSAEDLKALFDYVAAGNSTVGRCYTFTTDITLPADWKSIDVLREGATSSGKGKNILPFSGVINGNGHTLTVAEGGKPLLGYVRDAMVCNLNVYGSKIAGYGLVENYVVDYGPSGSYKGQTDNTVTFSNVTLKSGTQTLRSGFIGGYASGINAVYFMDCTVEAGVTIGYDKKQSNIGSFGGQTSGYLLRCVSAADVYGKNNVGGLIGIKGQAMGPCNVSDSEFRGSVYASGNWAGGIIGSGYDVYSAPNTPGVCIENCVCSGSVTGADYVGGILGGEPVMEQCWDNGIGYIRNNHFIGTVTAAGGENLGGIIGYLKSLNRYNVIENNRFRSTCGAKKGIGRVLYVDTSLYSDGTDRPKGWVGGTYYMNTAEDSLDKIKKDTNPDGAYYNISKRDHNRTDDPLGADADNLTRMDSPVPEPEPEPSPVRLLVSGSYKRVYTVGDELNLDGMSLAVVYDNGTQTAVPVSEAAVSGFDSSTAGDKTLMIRHSNVSAAVSYSVKNVEKTVTVSVSILGDSLHSDPSSSGGPHGLARGGLTIWASESGIQSSTTETVWDVLQRVFIKYNLSVDADAKNQYGSVYIRSVNGLGEFDNGQNSGWMYTINGHHPDVGVSAKFVKDGDKIVLHYTDDYTYEEGGINYGKSDSASGDTSTANTATQNSTALKAMGSTDKCYTSTGDYMETLGTPSVGSIGGEWMVIGLARSGREVPGVEDYYQSVVDFVREHIDENQRLHKAKSTDNSRLILALTAIGKDVTNVDGHNLLLGLNDLDFVKKQGNNGPIWALLALDCGNYPEPEGNVTRQALVSEILSVQTSDGGWAISGDEADSDMTGMALQSLAPYYSRDPAVQEAVDRAIARLSQMQNDDGGFSTFSGSGGKVATSESASQVIVALAALGIDPHTDQRFVKNGCSVIDALQAYSVAGGGFRHTLDGQLDGMATEQAYYAMTAYYRLLTGKTSLYDMTDVIDMGGVEKSVPVETTPNSLAVAGTVETSQHDEVWTLLLGLSVGILFGIVLGIGLSAVVVVMYVKMKKRFDK